MFQILRYRGVATVFLPIVAVAIWGGELTPTISAVDVKAKNQNTQSVRYLETRTNSGGFGTSDNSQSRRCFVLGRYLQRVETLDADRQIEFVTISDYKNGRYVTLQPKLKRFTELAAQVTVNSDSRTRTQEKSKPALDTDLYAKPQEIPAEATTRLSAKRVGDKQAVGFLWEQVIEKQSGTQTSTRTYWVDPDSMLPICININFRSTEKQMGRSSWVQTGFVFDAQIDESLFSTDPPDGYSIQPEAKSFALFYLNRDWTDT